MLCQSLTRLPVAHTQEMYAAQTAALLEMADWPLLEMAGAARGEGAAEAEWAKLQRMAEER